MRLIMHNLGMFLSHRDVKVRKLLKFVHVIAHRYVLSFFIFPMIFSCFLVFSMTRILMFSIKSRNSYRVRCWRATLGGTIEYFITSWCG